MLRCISLILIAGQRNTTSKWPMMENKTIKWVCKRTMLSHEQKKNRKINQNNYQVVKTSNLQLRNKCRLSTHTKIIWMWINKEYLLHIMKLFGWKSDSQANRDKTCAMYYFSCVCLPVFYIFVFLSTMFSIKRVKSSYENAILIIS